jgi:hypothetical protein
MNNLEDNYAEYLSALIKTQGVAVVTVSDGWVFTFSKHKLISLLSGKEDAENIMIFVKKL